MFDPISAIAIFAAGAASMAAIQRGVQARQNRLDTELGMAVVEPSPPDALPNTLEAAGVDVLETIWEVMGVKDTPVALQLYTGSAQLPSNRADFDEFVRHGHSPSGNHATWNRGDQDTGTEPRSLWLEMQRAWLGYAPPFQIGLDARSEDGEHVQGTIDIEIGMILADFTATGMDIDLFMESISMGDGIIEQHLMDRIATDPSMDADEYVNLGGAAEDIGEESFSETMNQLSTLLDDLANDASRKNHEASSKLNEHARLAADQAEADREALYEDGDDWEE